MANIFNLLGLHLAWQIMNLPLLTAVNTCGECARSPTMCRRISGLFTVTVLTEGTYNPVVRIPSPACSLNITELSSSSNYIAVKTEGGQGIINSYWGIGQPGQYFGAGASFLYDKQSATCKGTCIYSEGPTSEPLVIQILYYEKNPGIAYEFVLPNTVPFTPLDGTSPKQSTSLPPSLPTSASRHQQRSGHSHHRQHRPHRPHHENASPSSSAKFGGEYYTGTQFSRSEGRPDTVSALQSHISVNKETQSPRSFYDYTGSSYGSHTLGGRGMSYTHGTEDSWTQGRDYIDAATGRHVVDRYRPGSPQNLRRVVSPQYVPPSEGYRSAPPYGAQPHYQSFSSGTSLSHEDSVMLQVDESSYPRTISGQAALSHRQNVDSTQYRWKISGFTECSQTCGGGIQKTSIVCLSVSGRTQVVVTPENCPTHLKPRAQAVECNNTPCEPDWQVENWSECSVTCGSGTQTRIVECRQRFSSTLTLRVSADQCRQANKPAVAQQCEKGLCSQWRAGPWGECSKECAGGERRRLVQCVDRYESQIPPNYCTGQAPADVESCNTHFCTTQWWLSQWSQDCSEFCGQGIRNRTVLCMSNRGEIISEDLCDQSDLPAKEEVCSSDDGCHGSWFAGAWGKCSAQCGDGKRTRSVICLQRSINSQSVARDEECDASIKPDSEENCVNTVCSAQWFTSLWSECSVTCGEGIQTREVRCMDDKKSQSQRCAAANKPATHEKCVRETCTLRLHNYRPNKNDVNTDYTGYRREDNPEIKIDSGRRGEETGDNMIEDTRRENHRKDIRLPSISSTGYRTPGKGCEDTYWNCLMVIQARLCSYDYYRQLCCHSCQKV